MKMNDLVTKWIGAAESLDYLNQQIRRAETVLTNATNELGKHVNPGDQKLNEPITCWVRIDDKTERLVESTLEHNNDYRIQWRGNDRKE